MKQHLKEEAELRRYLLGELNTAERVAVEARLFLDDAYRAQLQAVEDELIDDYAYDELGGGEREQIEAGLLTGPERRDDLMLTRALKRYLSRTGELGTPPLTPAPNAEPGPETEELPPPPRKDGPLSFLSSLFLRRPVAGFALAAAALVILALTAWRVFDSQRRPDGPIALEVVKPTPAPTESPESRPPERGSELPAAERPTNRASAEVRPEGQRRPDAGGREKDEHATRRPERPRASPSPTRQTPTQVATFLILPGGVARGPGQTGKVTLTPDIGTVRLRVPLIAAGDYRGYSATLQTGGRTIYTRDGLSTEVDTEVGQVVAIEVPARLLRRQRYRINLNGVTAAGQVKEINSYTFQVERRRSSPSTNHSPGRL